MMRRQYGKLYKRGRSKLAISQKYVRGANHRTGQPASDNKDLVPLKIWTTAGENSGRLLQAYSNALSDWVSQQELEIPPNIIRKSLIVDIARRDKLDDSANTAATENAGELNGRSQRVFGGLMDSGTWWLMHYHRNTRIVYRLDVDRHVLSSQKPLNPPITLDETCLENSLTWKSCSL